MPSRATKAFRDQQRFMAGAGFIPFAMISKSRSGKAKALPSIGEKLVHLSLEIEDKSKSAALLERLIADQSSRFAAEISNIEAQLEGEYIQYTDENKAKQASISLETESLFQREKTLDTSLAQRKLETQTNRRSSRERRLGLMGE